MDVEIPFGTAGWLRLSPSSNSPFIMTRPSTPPPLSVSELFAKYLTHLTSALTTIHLKAAKTIKIKEPEEDADK